MFQSKISLLYKFYAMNIEHCDILSGILELLWPIR